MIRSVTIGGFKRFATEEFDFAQLTILTGLNGAGKTTLLQAMLMAAEASTTQAHSLPLNGPFGLELGTAEDVLNWQSKSPIRLEFLTSDNGLLEWVFNVPSEEAFYLNIEKRPAIRAKPFSGKPRSFTYLSAERLGPKGFMATSALPESELEVGVHGEYSAHVLNVLGDRPLENIERKHPNCEGGAPRLLKYEVEQWLSEITRPIEVTGERAPGSTVAEIKFRTPGSPWVRATNMGFGVSYALPIILAGLIAEKGGVLLVENPEAHLHPAGQSRMGVFLAWLAGRGVQTIVETHSDHVINGIRRAVAELRYLAATDSVVQWFGDKRASEEEALSTKLSIRDTGGLSAWPEGFFDQYQLDVSALGRLRREKRST